LSAYKDICNYFYAKLLVQTDLNEIFQKISYVWDEKENCMKCDMHGVIAELENIFTNNPAKCCQLLSDYLVSIRALNVLDANDYSFFHDSLKNLHPEWGWIVEEVEGKAVNGTAASDIIYGSYFNDTISGGAGNDTLDGFAGNDYLAGGDGADTYIFDKNYGQDTINNLDSDDLGVNIDQIQLGAGITQDDITIKTESSDLIIKINGTDDSLRIQNYFDQHGQVDLIIFGDGSHWDVEDVIAKVSETTDSNDSLYGYAADDSLFGRAGNDYISGGSGNDTLDGGTGNDTLLGGDGADIYSFNRGYGQDYIDNYDYDTTGTNLDKIQLGADITNSDITLRRQNDDLLLTINNTSDSLRVSKYFYQDAAYSYQVDKISFADSSDWDVAAVKAKVLIPTYGNDTIYGHATDDIIYGRAGDDTLYGNAGNDTLDGGIGNDTLKGGAGADTYYFALGYWQDYIDNYDADAAGTNIDKIQLGPYITQDDVILQRQNNDLLLKIDGVGDSLRVSKYFYQEAYQIDKIYFSDNSAWDVATVKSKVLSGTIGNDTLYGYDTNDSLLGGAGNDSIDGGSGNDTLDGGTGNDTLLGGDGANTYVFKRGYGSDCLAYIDNSKDKIQLGTGITKSDVTLRRIGDDLVISIKGTSDSLQVTKLFYQCYDSQVPIMFADGSSWNIATIKSLVSTPTSGNDYLYGYDTNDRILGGDGNDYIYGGRGNDTLEGGTGDDTLDGTDYFDNDSLDGGTGNDSITGGYGNDILRGGTGDDILEGGSGNDTLDGGVGKDTLYGGDGADTYIFDIGYGQDYINNYEYGNLGTYIDKIQLGAGITQDNIILRRQHDDLLLTVKGTEDSLRIYSYFWLDATDDYTVEQICFTGGSVWDVKTVKEKAVYGPTDGDDQIDGSVNADSINGGSGNDYIFGDDGNDTLDGDIGNDTLEGGYGNDTYLFGRGYGKDYILNEFSGTSGDTIQLGVGILQDDISVRLIHNHNSYSENLLITINGTSDSLYVLDYPYYPVDKIVFADGSSWDLATVMEKAVVPTEGSDVLYGYKNDDNLCGGAGSDTILGFAGNDTLDGGTGDDNLSGYEGNDIVYGGSGKDRIYGDSGDDTIDGGTGNDMLYGDTGNDLFYGGAGNDILIGEEGNDILYGGSGNDIIYGDSGNDTLDGGAGNDTLFDRAGADTYVFGRGFGQDTIENYDDTSGKDIDKIKLGAGITQADVILRRQSDDLVLTIRGTSDSLRIKQYFYQDATQGYQMDEINFVNGGSWDVETVKAKVSLPSDGDDWLYGSDDYDSLFGGAGNDYLSGAAGYDTLDGGAGNDTLEGGDGADTYLFDKGYGQDHIKTWDRTALGANIENIRLGAGITQNDVTLRRLDDSLILTLKDTSDSLWISNYFYQETTYGDQVDPFEFTAGGSWTADVVREKVLFPSPSPDCLYGYSKDDNLSGGAGNDYLSGGAGNDTLDGGAHDDYLIGGDGSDTYIFARDYGKDTINNQDNDEPGVNPDSIQLGSGITQNDVSLRREYNDLIVTIKDTSDSLRVASYFFGDSSYQVEQIKFTDGGSWDVATVRERVLQTTAGNDSLYGYETDDSLLGGDGNDSLSGDFGKDTLDGGAGNDTLSGGAGSDTYLFGRGYGQDYIFQDKSSSDLSNSVIDRIKLGVDITQNDVTLRRQNNGLLLLINGTSDSLTIANYFHQFSDYKYRIDQICFADESIWNSETILEKVAETAENDGCIFGSDTNDSLIGGAGDDYLFGGVGDDTLDGGPGNDTLQGGYGDNTYIYARGYGQDIIDNDYSYYDINIQLAAGITQNDLILQRQNDDLVIALSGTTDMLRVNKYFINSYAKIKFADGDIWNVEKVKQIMGSEPTDGDDWLYGSIVEERINGGLGHDYIFGDDGDDTLDGGAGNDTLEGGDGSNTYVFARGYGQDIIERDYEEYSGIIQFGPDITQNDISLWRDNYSLVIKINDTSDSLIVVDNYNYGSSDLRIDQFIFADGLIWEQEDIEAKLSLPADGNGYISGMNADNVLFVGNGNDYISGGTGNDTLDGGMLNDYLAGGDGADTYVFGRGYGQDTIYNMDYDITWVNIDKIQLAENILPADVMLWRESNNDLLLTINGTTDCLTVQNYFSCQYYSRNIYYIDQICFADGTVWDVATVMANAIELLPTSGDDIIMGGSGNDCIYGDSGNDTLMGGAGNDTLNGNAGSNILDGGAGNDYLSNTYGDSTYIITHGSGFDYIYSNGVAYSSGNTIKYGEGISPENLSVQLTIDETNTILAVGIGDNEGTMISSYTSQDWDRLAPLSGYSFVFADGRELTFNEIKALADNGIIGKQFGTESDDILMGSVSDDEIYGKNANDVIYGRDNNDIINGESGNDTLDGGYGNDTLIGDAGADTYIFGRDYDKDIIYNYDGVAYSMDIDKIKLGAGITTDDVIMKHDNNDLILLFKNSSDELTVKNYFYKKAYYGYQVDQINFADGASWDVKTVKKMISVTTDSDDILYGENTDDVLTGKAGNDFIYGDQGNDTLDGGTGNDSLEGGDGADTYVFERGSGQDIIDNQDNDAAGINIDKIQLGTYITPEDVTLLRQRDDLVLMINGTSGSLCVSNYFKQASYQIDQISFNNGSLWDVETIMAKIFVSNAGDDTLIGSGNNDNLAGGAGNDSIYGGGGNDTLDGGIGNDSLEGGDGADTYVFARGNAQDVIDNKDNDPSGTNIDKIHFGAYITPEDVALRRQGDDLVLMINGTSDSLCVSNYFKQACYQVDQISFNNGSIWDVETVLTKVLLPTSDNDHIIGFAGNDNINGGAGNDVLNGGAGDDFLFGDSEDDTLDGGTGNDYLQGDDGADTYVFDRGYGQDTINNYDNDASGLNVDKIQLGDGVTTNDVTLTRQDDHLIITINGTTDTLCILGYFYQDGASEFAVEQINFAEGSSWDVATVKSKIWNSNSVVLIGDTGNDAVAGGSGADTLVGGDGVDTLTGGAGDDVYYLGTVDHLIVENANEGIDTVNSSVSYTLGSNLENLTLTGENTINGFGNELDNILTGNTEANTLNGYAGADTMSGGAGSDIYIVDNSGDVVIENIGEGTDTISSSMTCTLNSNVENLVLAGTDAINGTGNELNNILSGNSANNMLNGGSGNDSLYGNEGDDIYVFGRGSGSDKIYNYASDYVAANDMVVFGEEVSVANLKLLRNGDNLRINIDDSRDKLAVNPIDVQKAKEDSLFTFKVPDKAFECIAAGDVLNIADWFKGNAYQVDQFKFSDGTILTATQLEALGYENAQALTFSANLADGTALPSWIMFDAASMTFSGTPTNDDVGKLSIKVVATDVWGDSVSNTFNVIVHNINDAPVLVNAIADQTIMEDAAFNFTVPANTFTDVDTEDKLTYIASLSDDGYLPFWLTFNAATMTFSGAPTNDNIGTLSLKVTATDKAGTNASCTFNVTTLNVNDAPQVVSMISDQMATEDIAFSFTVPNDTFVDMDAGDVLTYRASMSDGTALPLWLTFDPATMTFSGTPTNEDVGTLSINVKATDTTGASVSNNFKLFVENVNDAPFVINAVADQNTKEDMAFNFTIPANIFADVDAGDVLTYSAKMSDGSELPSWLAFDSETMTFNGTPDHENVGTLAITITAMDIAGDSAACDFNITIENSNNAPAVSIPVADQTTPEDAPFNFTVPVNTFNDVDKGDVLTYSATLSDGMALPSWLSFNAENHTFSGTPTNDNVGTLSLKVTVTDLAGATVATSFNVNVINVNDAPVVSNSIADQSTLEDALFNFSVPFNTFTDVDAGDVMTFSATLSDGMALPSWLSFNAATRTFSGTPTNDNVGILSLKVTATDLAGASASTSFNVNVINVNDAPVVSNAVADQSTLEDVLFNFTLPSNTFTDVDKGDVLTYSATLSDGTALPSWLSFNTTTRTFSGTPTNDNVGSMSLKVTATDTTGAKANTIFNVNVINVNDAPYVSNAIVNQTTTGNTVFSFTVPANTFTDVDKGDVLTYSATLSDGTALPSWLSFNTTTRTFNGIPTDAGTIAIKVTTNDQAGATASTSFNLTVQNNVIIGTEGDDWIQGTEDSEVIYGLGGNDMLYGYLGVDTLIGGSGDDTLISDFLDIPVLCIGGTGNDTYLVYSTSCIISENAGEGSDSIVSAISCTLPANVENLVLSVNAYGEPVAINGTGNALDNNIVGNSLGNMLIGAAGNDTLDGYLNADTLIGGAGNDTYIVDDICDVIIENIGEGLDSVQSSITITLAANVENLTLTDTSAINGAGNILDNTITGNLADNNINGGMGADTMNGGAGNDVYVVDNAGDVITENANEGMDIVQSSATITLATNVENLLLTGISAISGTGNTLDNYLTGNTAANTLTGNAGNDTLDGGTGADSLIGGTGNDTYIVDNTGDVITENAGEGTDTVQTSLAYTLANNMENLTLTGTTAINGTGNTLDNYLTGNSAANTLTGNAGNDTLDGGTGADALIGGAGNDTYIVDNTGDAITENSGDGTDTVQTSLAYTLGNNVENLTLTGTTAVSGTGNTLDNYLTGNSAANTLTGNAGNDTLDGGTGADSLIGGAGNDTYIVDNASDVITENTGDGTDTVRSSITLTLAANVENLILTGTNAINATGNTLANTITGNSAANTLSGGTGADTLIGGAGNDIYVVDNTGDVITENANEGTDTVQSSVTYTLSNNVENLTLTGTTAINATGNTLDNYLTGNSAVNTLTGGAGNDTLDGGTGADSLIGGTGNDTYIRDNTGDVITENAGEGTDTVQTSLAYTLGNNVENLTLTGTSAISGTGNTLDNYLTGNSAANTLTGNAGNDTLDGGVGADSLVGGAGNDTYSVDNTGDTVTESASSGTDTVRSSITLTLASNVENLILTGTAAINGTGNTLANTITGNSAANTLSGGTGADTMIGGAGNDTYIVDNTGDVVTENANEGTDTVQSSVTYTMGNNVENLTLTGTTAINGTGNTLDNYLTGNSAANTLTGGAGNDTLDGGTGADSLIGGAGNDTYIRDNTGDVITENAGEGTDTVQTSLAYTLGNNVENLTLTGTTAVSGTGNTLDNYLTGNTAANTLTGGAGNDTLDGGSGADSLIGGTGNDTYIRDNVSDVITENASEGTDTVITSLAYTLGNNVENLTLTGTTAISGTGNTLDNYLTGNSAANTLTGGAGNDTLDGGAGADSLIGGTGNDTYIRDNTGDVITENAGEGTDTVITSLAYTMGNNVENLTLTGTTAINGTGNTLDNYLTGSSAANTLTGDTGNDTIDGGLGNDSLVGGAGNDTYLFRRTDGIDTINDYNATTTDADILKLTNGIASTDPVIVKQINDLYVFVDSGDYIQIASQFTATTYGIERLEVSDGHYITRADIETIVNTMSTINNNTGMDVMQKYTAMMSDSTYIATLANTWKTM